MNDKVDYDLGILAIITSAFIVDGYSDEIKQKAHDVLNKYGIDFMSIENFHKDGSEAIEWLDETIAKFQNCIEEYNALEREG